MTTTAAPAPTNGSNGHRPRGPETFCPPSSAFEPEATRQELARMELERRAQLGLPDWAQELHEWWTATADADISGSIEKIVEYGGDGPAYDLLATGHDIAALSGREVGNEEAVELAVMVYLSSKVNRWLAAAKDGRRPSDDTLLDIAYYAMMARRNRAVGGWPTA